ncbi:glycosyltransferase [Pseudarthrobacter sp. GA104]|uniref:glycosyltransferase n=1 Tax=Pseudarthrobacter sp. GA104 TaxID=2676311 RepID=UPI0012FAD967|nr:nucleotide disphospho-sugar-binding domain-containing protein [Pseudarthrobacter sp. GA104]MUU72572.1 glycosyltransferase [Pseudarthrobacter sp. GA104]
MSTVLGYTSPAIGHLFPMVPLLLELNARGHDVHVRALPGQVPMLRSAGLHAEPVDQRLLELVHRDYLAKSVKANLASSTETFTARARIDAPDLRSAIGDVNPDLLLVDINAWGARMVAEASGLPWGAFSPYTPPLQSKGTPPFGPGLDPMPGPLGRIRDALVRPLVTGAVEKLMLPGINRVRADISAGKLPPVRSVDAFFRTAPLTLVTTSEPFEYPHPDWAPDVRMIGALSWEPPAPLPAWLGSLKEPVILVTTSSEYQADEAIVHAALQGLAGEPFTVVATLPAAESGAAGAHRASSVDGFGQLPPNARLEHFLPHGPVLEHAAVAITHGGMGATQKALAKGVPVVVVPFGRDQHEVAARVVAAGAGVRLSRRKLTPGTLRAAVHEALGKREGARRVADGFRAAGGAAAGADALEQLVRIQYG